MMYYIHTHTIQGKNNLQRTLVAEAEKWNGTLIKNDEARQACITEIRKTLEHCNGVFPKSSPCRLSTHENSLTFATDKVDDTFVILTFYKVKNTYDGIMLRKEKEGGAQ